MHNPIRILAVDDHALFREALVRLLESEPELEVVGQCESVTQAAEILRGKAVDLVLLDYELGSDSGAGLPRRLTDGNERVKVLVVTAGISDTRTREILAAGASGVFFKHDGVFRLLEAIRRIAQGEIWLDDRALRSLLAGSNPQPERPDRETVLSLRQQEVLSSILQGLSNKEITWKLQVSVSTIKAAIQELFEKTGVRSRSQLARAALERREAGLARCGDQIRRDLITSQK